MTPHPNDPTTANDLTLVDSARAGDRLAFGVLYLRHHAAAWRVACVVSRFSPDAELAVIEGFTRVFSVLPEECEALGPEGVSFRPYLLACVRQAALDRVRAAGREHGDAPPAPLAGLAPSGELVLSSLEHHVARQALAALPERMRTALWLSDVEAMTPSEISALLGGRPDDITELVADARTDVRIASNASRSGHEARAGCRFTVANLEAFQAATLDPAKGVLVRSHLDICPSCRMRLGELANGPATLAAAVPAAPLLGGEAQHHWVVNASGTQAAPAVLPPGRAAAAIDLPLPARRLAVAVAGVSEMARQAGHTIRPVVPVLALVVAWLAVMLSLPQLIQPGSGPGPAGLALPAVQAYRPDYLPGGGARPAPATNNAAAEPAPLATGTGAAGGAELAIQFEADDAPAGPEPAVEAVAKTAASRQSPAKPPAPPPIPTVAATVGEVAAPPLVTAAVPVVTPTVAAVVKPNGKKTKAAKDLKDLRRRLERLDEKLRSSASLEPRRLDIASLRSDAREDSDGRVARRAARRRHAGQAESA